MVKTNSHFLAIIMSTCSSKQVQMKTFHMTVNLVITVVLDELSKVNKSSPAAFCKLCVLGCSYTPLVSDHGLMQLQYQLSLGLFCVHKVTFQTNKQQQKLTNKTPCKINLLHWSDCCFWFQTFQAFHSLLLYGLFGNKMRPRPQGGVGPKLNGPNQNWIFRE